MVTQIVISLRDTSKTLYGSSIISYTCSQNLTDTYTNPTAGICEQYANIEFYDTDNYFHQLATQGSLVQNAKVKISVIDNNEETILGTYFVSDWDIDGMSNIVKITCRDMLYLLESINIQRVDRENRLLTNILDIIFSTAGVNYSFLDTETHKRCDDIVITDSWWLESDLKTLLNKVCEVGMLRVFWYNDQFIVGRSI